MHHVLSQYLSGLLCCSLNTFFLFTAFQALLLAIVYALYVKKKKN